MPVIRISGGEFEGVELSSVGLVGNIVSMVSQFEYMLGVTSEERENPRPVLPQVAVQTAAEEEQGRESSVCLSAVPPPDVAVYAEDILPVDAVDLHMSMVANGVGTALLMLEPTHEESYDYWTKEDLGTTVLGDKFVGRWVKEDHNFRNWVGSDDGPCLVVVTDNHDVCDLCQSESEWQRLYEFPDRVQMVLTGPAVSMGLSLTVKYAPDARVFRRMRKIRSALRSVWLTMWFRPFLESRFSKRLVVVVPLSGGYAVTIHSHETTTVLLGDMGGLHEAVTRFTAACWEAHRDARAVDGLAERKLVLRSLAGVFECDPASSAG